MKVLLPLLAAGIALSATAANEVYQTSNEGIVYTFADLAKIEGSGVTKTGENIYTVEKDIEVPANDGLTLENNTTLRLGADVIIKMWGGKHNFAPADTATITSNGDGVMPKGIQFTDMDKTVEVKHIRFEGAGVKFGGPAASIVENCTFYEHNDKIGHYAINYAGHSMGNEVRHCYFLRTAMSAIGAGANIAAGVVIEDNIMEDCSTANRNYPVINETPAADNGPIIIRRNKILGGKRLMPGAISVSNMLSMIGDHKVIIEDNYIDNSRYGLNLMGHYMDFRVTGNTILNCHYESNSVNGGSGVTVYSQSADNASKVYMSGNRIEGCLWGVTLVGTAVANLGNISVDASSADYNPGGNSFKNNGNCGKAPEGAETAFDPSIPYDLYNNTAATVYAQGNVWGGADQSDAEVEKRIFHKADDAKLGEVIYKPVGTTSGISVAGEDNFDISVYGDGAITIEGAAVGTPVSVYDVTGSLLYSGVTDETIQLGRKGLVVVVVGNKAVRVAL
ncbi:hypothetical protein [uncultured Muribaculum sp.]|uniref:hypothetical protein n=1 Tax=uncultured Muribaculum sp. TaxID=1918613 RepID=UPI0025B17038|nr:hypothetical protein [uncultured Muribaculum sp.]